MFPNEILLLLIGIIILIEIIVKKKVLGIIILHNNDHTLNKVLQNLIMFMQNHEIHYQILVIKEKIPIQNRSTGYLFNIGLRQMPGMSHYLCIDTNNMNLLNINQSKKIKIDDLFINNGINYLEGLNGIIISRNYFKEIDGFPNKSNKTFIEFLENIRKNKQEKYGGYFSMNLDIKYEIIDRLAINANASRITIQYI